jgi:phage gp36-like protein
MLNRLREHLQRILTPSQVQAGHTAIDRTALTNADSSFLTHRYFLLLLLLVLFWPVLLTVVAASVSASAWLFWLLIGAVFGLLQLLYVLYNFVMITLDLGGLTLLKSFALIRSYVRYYGYKMYNAAGISRRSSARKKNFRRRKEWREEVEKATCFEQYSQIELFEPQQDVGATCNDTCNSGDMEAIDKVPAASPRSGFGLRKRRLIHTRNHDKHTIRQPSSPKRSSYTTTNQNPPSPNSPMRKIHSCLDFKPSSSNVDRRPSPVKRVSSTASLPNDSSHEMDQNCPRWQRIVRQDLGMAGDMLLTTMARLREARMQATSNSATFDDDGTTSSHDNEHDASPSKLSPDKQRSDDYSSSLKFLLSGIIKRNHLSVDDALIDDCRSIAERGQHSLRTETRDAIDSYGDEVERCMDWVANGPVPLGVFDASNEDGISREQVMQRQLDELEKRYTLVKRMKQNMGHTALMLSGGGG